MYDCMTIQYTYIYIYGCSIVPLYRMKYSLLEIVIGAQDQMGAEVFPLLLPSDAAATRSPRCRLLVGIHLCIFVPQSTVG